MNLTASTTGNDPDEDVLTLSGVMAIKANAAAGVMADEVVNSISIAFEPKGSSGREEEEESEGVVVDGEAMTTLRWLQGDEGDIPTDVVCEVPLAVAAPGVLMGSANGATATIAAPKFASFQLGSGVKMVLRKQDDAAAKTWQQQYGTPLMLGGIFILNMVVRFYMNSGSGGGGLFGGGAPAAAAADAGTEQVADAAPAADASATKTKAVKGRKSLGGKGKSKHA
jgi:hypothetical protein